MVTEEMAAKVERVEKADFKEYNYYVPKTVHILVDLKITAEYNNNGKAEEMRKSYLRFEKDRTDTIQPFLSD